MPCGAGYRRDCIKLIKGEKCFSRHIDDDAIMDKSRTKHGPAVGVKTYETRQQQKCNKPEQHSQR